jgi:hypothetical protein
MSLKDADGHVRLWNSVDAKEWSEEFPARPKSLRKMAFALRQLNNNGVPFTMHEWELAEKADVSLRTWQRNVHIFEEWGILEVKRWRYRKFGGGPNTYRVFIAKPIPSDYKNLKPPFRVSPRQTA